jgi:hypothetical protein
MRGPLYFDDVEDREQAIALLDGARRCAQIRQAEDARATRNSEENRAASAGAKWPPAVPAGWPAPKDAAITPGIKAETALLRAAVARSPSFTPAWREVAELAERNVLSDDDKRVWAEAVMKAAGARAPDFSADILLPMIRSVKDAARRNEMFDWAAREFAQRPDVVARARFEQAAAFEVEGKQEEAWETLVNVIHAHANDGSVVVDALAACERLLAKAPNRDAVQKTTLDLYADALRRISRPGTMSGTFGRSSSHYRVGTRYADLLERAGNQREADRIRRSIAADEE